MNKILFVLILLALISFANTAPATIPVRTITITGAPAQPTIDSSISYAGDINGDGIGDLVIGSYTDNNSPLTATGNVYVVFGPLNSISTLDLTTLTSSQGFKIIGDTAGGQIGLSVKYAGDINADGVDDFIIGAQNVGPGGYAYVIYGKKSGFSDIKLATMTSSQGFKIKGASGDSLGASVSYAGDFNYDGVDDIIIGAPLCDSAATANVGCAYIIFGNENGLEDIDLSNYNSAQAIKITGETATTDSFGVSVSYAGDFNNDGIDDVVIGAYNFDPLSRNNAGRAYVIFGQENIVSDIDTITLTTTKGIKISGGSANNLFGKSVSNAGDMNGDSISDIVIGAPGALAAYVLYGKSTGLSNLDLQSFSSASGNGFKVTGNSGDSFGDTVAYAGDMNRDALGDVIIGGYGATSQIFPYPTGAGCICVVYGKTYGLSDLNYIDVLIDDSLGFVKFGTVANQHLGHTVAYSKNIDGIASHSVIVKSLQPDNSGTISIYIGSSYYIYWDYTHLPNCLPPLLDQSYYGLTFCINPCLELDNYYYWDGTCRDSCDFPLSTQVYKERNFCEFPCLNTEILQPDGSCTHSCDAPLYLVIDGKRKICTKIKPLPTVIQVAKKAATVNKVGQILLSAISYANPSQTTTLTLLKNLVYMRYLNIGNTPRLKLLYTNSDASPNNLNIAPKVPAKVKNTDQSSSLDDSFAQYDVESSFIVNYWTAFISLLILSIIYTAIWISEISLKRWPRKHPGWELVPKTRLMAQNFIIQQFYSTFGDVIFFVVLEFKGSSSFSFSSVLAIVWLLIAIGIFVYHFVIIRKYRKIAKKNSSGGSASEKEIQNFNSKNAGFAVLYTEFDDSSFLTQAFLMIFIIRGILSNLILLSFYKYPLVQLLLMIALGCLMLYLLMRTTPHKKAADLWQAIALETILLFVNFCIMGMLLYQLAKARYDVHQFYMGEIVLTCHVLAYFVPIGCIIVRLSLAINRRRKSGRGWHIKVLVNDIINPKENQGIQGKMVAEDPEKTRLNTKNAEESPTKIRIRLHNNMSKIVPVVEEKDRVVTPVTPVTSVAVETPKSSKPQEVRINLLQSNDSISVISPQGEMTERHKLIKARIQSRYNSRIETPKSLKIENEQHNSSQDIGYDSSTPMDIIIGKKQTSTISKFSETREIDTSRKELLGENKGLLSDSPIRKDGK